MPNKMMILSIDALQTDDIEFLATLPNFSEVLKKAAIVKNIREVYPTLTNVNHVSIITGVSADQHGIYHNMSPFVPTKTVNWNVIGQNWFWKNESIKVPTLVDAAKEKGLVTACVAWPSLGGQIPDYNLAEMWPQTESTIRKTYEISSTQNVMDLYFDEYIAPFNFKESMDIDFFSVPIAADMIKNIQPDLMLEHIIWLDHCRHKLGNNHPKIQEALTRIDNLFGVLVDAFKEAGTYETTNFFIMGDHGQMDIKEVFNLNVALKNHGLVHVDEEGNVLDYEAYSFSAGFSTQIILKDSADLALIQKVHNILKTIMEEYPEYVERIYTADEALAEEALSGNFSFVVEAIAGICFENPFDGPIIISTDDPDYKGYRSNHGYHPSKGPKPVFIAFGPDIKEGIIQDGASVLDECPTFAKLLEVNLPDMTGKPLEIIKRGNL
ncbi:MAG: alkaline phosphatase family protein [Clostridiales bacterium]|nr:alkaline phosphatase family protein [Clostridiales bacterium]